MMASTPKINSESAAGLLGVSARAVRAKARAGQLDAVTVHGFGGNKGSAYAFPLEDALAAASPERRILWYAAQSGASAGVTEADPLAYREKYGEDGIEEAARRLQACLAMDGLLGSGGRGKSEAIAEIAAEAGASTRTLRRWHAAWRERGLAGILNRVQRRDAGTPRTACPLARDYIEARLCDNRKFPQSLILERLTQVAQEMGDGACDCCPYHEGSEARRGLPREALGDYPVCGEATGRMIIPANRHAVNRFAQTISQAQLTYARNGKRAWEAAYMQKAKRQKPVRVNECWFGDHHKLDLFVSDENGHVVRPWMTAWMDAYSGVFVGWALTLEPNGDTVADSFARAAVYTVGSEVAGLPCTVYIDNGKDYRSTRFEGGRIEQGDLGRLNAVFDEKAGMLQTLGVGVVHAKPYRGWSKNIERAFGVLERWIRELPGWCGDSPEQRPEDLGKTIRRLQKRGELLTFETFAKIFIERILPQYHAHKGEDGRSPQELYRSGERARGDVPDWATMAMLKSMRAERVVSTQGVRMGNTLYWHEAMADVIRERVTVLYNRGTNPSVTVMHRGKFLCEAEMVQEIGMLETDRERVEAHMADQKRQQKKITQRLTQVRQAVRRINREMYVEEIDAQRERLATVVSMEARRAQRGQDELRERAEGKRRAAASGADAVRTMMTQSGRAFMEKPKMEY